MLPVQAPRSNDDFWFVPLGRWCRRGGAWFKRGVSCHSFCESICCLLVVTSRSMSVFRDSIEGCGCLFFCWKSEFAEICWIWVNVQPRVWRGLTSKGSYMGAIMEWSNLAPWWLLASLSAFKQPNTRLQVPTAALNVFLYIWRFLFVSA